MENEVAKLIADAKNIAVIPASNHALPGNVLAGKQESEPESLCGALALFYTLKELQKNVNLIVDDFPEKLKFLTPSADFVSAPQNFVISIPKTAADVSQIYYEKGPENLNIHITCQNGNLKKEQISFYYSEARPDLIVTVGINDFKKELDHKLDSFGYLLGAPIINIGSTTSETENTKFGNINLVQNNSISQTTFSLVKNIGKNISKNPADCLLTGLLLHYNFLQSTATRPAIFATALELMEKGADYQSILQNLKRV